MKKQEIGHKAKTLKPQTAPQTAAKAGQPLTERLQVAVRVRPLHPELELGHAHIITQTGPTQLTVKSELYHDLQSQFDAVLFESTQFTVFTQVVQPLLPNFLNGFNCTVYTYGQTGSGKTYTMFGPTIANKHRKEQERPKIVHRNRFSTIEPHVSPLKSSG